MNRQDAEKLITGYVKPIFGFALKRCKSLPDAEDLSQEIILRAFRALIVRDDVADAEKFTWTVAHHALSNYYRDTAKSTVGIPIDEVAELIADPSAEPDTDDGRDAICDAIRRLQAEIAYLSKLQRKIVIAYYFENRRQADIAGELGIPLGTVKWHLFEAKKELKRGMDTMRKTSELKFHPIRFADYGFSGSIGTKTPDEFFRSALPQNICYCVRDTAKTVNEIADDLGVSPVYVESEAEILEEYGYLVMRKDKYIANFFIDEPDTELLGLQDAMYKRAAGMFANALYDELVASGILDDSDIRCGWMDQRSEQTDIRCRKTNQPGSVVESCRADCNFVLWALIPYIAAWSGEKLREERISFEEVATMRPDGTHNIFHASVITESPVFPENYVHMKNWSGPMWNSDGKRILWQINSEWSDRARPDLRYQEDAMQVLSLYEREKKELLSGDEYAWLAERGYVKTNGDYDGDFQAVWQVVILASDEIRDRLLAVGERIKAKYQADFDALKAPYAEAVLKKVPAHLKKVKEYELQFVFHSDGWFLLHCITTLLQNGKLTPPTEEQRRAITTMIVNA